MQWPGPNRGTNDKCRMYSSTLEYSLLRCIVSCFRLLVWLLAGGRELARAHARAPATSALGVIK
jgi:hypothetical protein